jgi:nitrogen fixation protein FixH
MIGPIRWLRQGSRWIPACFFAFFGVVFAVNGVMVYVAMSSWTGVIERAYDRGLGYNRKLAAARAQDELGWQAAIDFEQQGGAHGFLALTVEDGNGNGIGRAEAHALFHRPTHEGHDFLVRLEAMPGGGFGAPVELPLEGMWDVRVQIDRGEVSYRFAERIFVR